MVNTAYFISIVVPNYQEHRSQTNLISLSSSLSKYKSISNALRWWLHLLYYIDIDVDNNLTAQNKTLKYLEELSSINIIVGWRYFPIDPDVDIVDVDI